MRTHPFPPGAEKYLPVMDSLLESGTKDEISEFLRAAARFARAAMEHPLHHFYKQGCRGIQAAA